jgi:periplasmic protein TonB
MASTWQPRRNRIGAALAAAGIQCGLAAMIIWGLAGRPFAPPQSDSQFVAITPTKPPAPTPSPTQPEQSAPAAPPARKAKPMPVAAPSPRIAIASPTPVATVAGQGTQMSAGAALAGPGSGAGGEGQGSGAGGSGQGGGGGLTYPPVRVAGALSDRDYPQGAGEGLGGTVAISFRVRRDNGQVDSCRVIGSSGAGLLDELTCELVERRFRYRPARDASGRPVDYVLRTSFTWGLRQRG